MWANTDKTLGNQRVAAITSDNKNRIKNSVSLNWYLSEAYLETFQTSNCFRKKLPMFGRILNAAFAHLKIQIWCNNYTN